MPALDAFWHLANFFAPAFGLGAVAAAAAKLLWRRELAGTAWWRLAAWAAGAAALAATLGLVAFGHDGRLLTYAAMVCASALALWWVGLRRSG